jgi:uncharacterized protein YkwD
MIVLLLFLLCLGLAGAQTDEQRRVLDLHNTLRAQHAAGPLTWDSELAKQAAEHAARCRRDSKTERETDTAAVLSTVGVKNNPGVLEDMVRMW